MSSTYAERGEAHLQKSGEASIERRPPMLVIEQVTPQVDGGRYPAKRTMGEACEVGAAIFKDGHDLMSARILAKGPGSRVWEYFPLTYDFNSDRWYGSFPLDRVGRWTFTVEAWPDVFATWTDELDKKMEAGQDISSELLEGAAIVRGAAGRAAGITKAKLLAAAESLEDENTQTPERARLALDPELRDIMKLHFDPALVTRHDRVLEIIADRERAAHGAWYEFFPRSTSKVPGKHGTFRDAAVELQRIAELGFDVVYLPPIHPIGRTHRKGPNNTLVAGPDDPGSPWAIGNENGGHTAVEPKLGTVEDFDRFVERANQLGIEVALDNAIQCSPDHPWVTEHPEWFNVRPDGTIKYAENPPKKYQDIYPLNFWCEDWENLWKACRDVFLYWIDHGVRIFRVDNPHTKPFAFWEWVIEDIRREHPDIIFLAEAFTRPNRMKSLAKLGFTQSYTYFTWRNEPADLRDYMIELTQTGMAEYYRGNFFANTPDILTEYLQTGGRPAFRIRLLLAATLSPNYGIYSGFELCENTPREPGSEEYLNSEKYEVRHRDWDAEGNINEDIRLINRIRRENPTLQHLTNLSFQHSENDRLLYYLKAYPGNDLLIVVNLDPKQAHESNLHVPLEHLGIEEGASFVVEDLLTGTHYTWRGRVNYVHLDPSYRVGHVFRVVRNEGKTR